MRTALTLARGRVRPLLLPVALSVLATVGAAVARADEEAVPGADDAESKNARLAALEGSASKWSAQLQFTYNGSTLSHPFDKDAVNPGHVTPVPVVSLTTYVAGRYRIDPVSSLGLRGGVVTETPLQGPKHTTYGDPTIDYSYAYNSGSFHNHFDPNYEHFTSHIYVDAGESDNFELYDNMIYELPFAVTLGVDWILDYNLFDVKAASPENRTKAIEDDVDVTVEPAIEYAFTDNFSFRTSTRMIVSHYRDKPSGTFTQHPTAQYVGFTYGFGKAGYINPYIKFAPYDGAKLSANTTAFGLAATVNLF